MQDMFYDSGSAKRQKSQFLKVHSHGTTATVTAINASHVTLRVFTWCGSNNDLISQWVAWISMKSIHMRNCFVAGIVAPSE